MGCNKNVYASVKHWSALESINSLAWEEYIGSIAVSMR